MEDTNIIMQTFEENENLKPLAELINQIMEMSDDALNVESTKIISGMIASAFTEEVEKAAIDSIVNNFEGLQFTKEQAAETIANVEAEFANLVDSLNPSVYKRQILNDIVNEFNKIFDASVDKYHNYNIDLLIKLDDGAQVPTYAHDTDACADLYAADDMDIPPHSFHNMVRTGVHIALPEGWMAMIFPRSSMGSKTELRLSNSVGIIDSEYRGQLGVLYDNLSDSAYTIKTGDRVAQILVMPSYRFKATVVDNLPKTARGEGGFGSTGK